MRGRGVCDEAVTTIARVVEHGHASRAADDLVPRRAGERVRGEQRPQPRPRRERAPELDEEHHLLREPVAGAARRLREAESEPAELRRLAPDGIVERRCRRDQLANTCDRKPLPEKRADRVADRLLVGAERQVHRVSAAARARARR